MEIINIRVEDHIRDALKSQAAEAGKSLSEYVRDLLWESVIPLQRAKEGRHGDEPSPETLPLIDRQVLSLLHRILARVLPPAANDEDGNLEHQLERARILEAGFTGEYWREVAGFETELPKRDSRRVIDILTMFRVLTSSVEHHVSAGSAFDLDMVDRLSYQGFDFNDPLESHMARYVEHFVNTQRFEELRPIIEKNDGGNSHRPMLPRYSRMLAEYRRVSDAPKFEARDRYLLSREELERIANA